MPLRAYALVVTVGLFVVALACTGTPSTDVTADKLVGEYVFRMGDSGAPQHDPDKLTLKPDGSYLLVHMPGGHPGSTEEGAWKLWSNLGQPQVAFGNTTYPVHIKGKHVRLMVNDDLDYYYEKTG